MGQPPEDMDFGGRILHAQSAGGDCAAQSPLCDAHHIPLRRMKAETFLVREQGSGTRSLMERVFAEKGLEPLTPIEMSSTGGDQAGRRGGLGIGAIIRAHAGDGVGLEAFWFVLDVEGFPVLRDWYIVHRAGKRLSAVAQAFRDFMLKKTTDIVHAPKFEGGLLVCA